MPRSRVPKGAPSLPHEVESAAELRERAARARRLITASFRKQTSTRCASMRKNWKRRRRHWSGTATVSVEAVTRLLSQSDEGPGPSRSFLPVAPGVTSAAHHSACASTCRHVKPSGRTGNRSPCSASIVRPVWVPKTFSSSYRPVRRAGSPGRYSSGSIHGV